MAEDNGIVRIDFLGTTEPIRAEIAMFRRDLAELRKDVRSGIGVAAIEGETKYTDAVRVQSLERTKIRKAEGREEGLTQREIENALDAHLGRELQKQKAFLAVSAKDYDASLARVTAATAAQAKEQSAISRGAMAEVLMRSRAEAAQLAEIESARIASSHAAMLDVERRARTEADQLAEIESARLASGQTAMMSVEMRARAEAAQIAERDAALQSLRFRKRSAVDVPAYAETEAGLQSEAGIHRLSYIDLDKDFDASLKHRLAAQIVSEKEFDASWDRMIVKVKTATAEQSALAEKAAVTQGGWFSRMFGHSRSGLEGAIGAEERQQTQIAKLSLYRQGMRNLPGLGESSPFAPVAGFAPFAMMGGHPAVAAGLIGGAGSMAWVYEVAKHGGAYQAALQQMSAQTKVTGKDLEAFGVSGRDLAKTFGYEAKENIDGYARLIDAFGLELAKSKPELDGMMKVSNQFAIAAKIDLPEAVNTLKGVFNNMGFSINGPGGAAQALKDYTAIAESFASATTRGQVRIDQLGDAFTKAGAVAARYGMTLNEIQASMETIGKTNLSGSQIGTGLRNIATYLGTADRNKQLRTDLAGIGLTPAQIDPATVGFSNALVTIKRALDSTNDSLAKNHIMLDLGKLRWQGVLDVLLKNLPVLQQYEKEIGQTGDLARMSAANLDTLEAKEKIVGKKLEDVLIGAFSGEAFNRTLDDIGRLADTLVKSEPQIATATGHLINLIDKILKVTNNALDTSEPSRAVQEITGVKKPKSFIPSITGGIMELLAPNVYQSMNTDSMMARFNRRFSPSEQSDIATAHIYQPGTDIGAVKGKSGTGGKEKPTPKELRDAYRTQEDALQKHLAKELDEYIKQGHTIEEIEAYIAKQQLAADEKKYAAAERLGQHDGNLLFRIQKEKVAIQKTADAQKEQSEQDDIAESTRAISKYYKDQITLVKEKVKDKTYTAKQGEDEEFSYSEAMLKAKLTKLTEYYADDSDRYQQALAELEELQRTHNVKAVQLDEQMLEERKQMAKSLDEQLAESKIALLPDTQEQATQRENLRYERSIKEINALKLEDIQDINARQRERNRLLREEEQIHRNIRQQLEEEAKPQGDVFDALRIAVSGLSTNSNKQFSSGGFTGDGHPAEAAGIVHRGEFVFDADSVMRIGLEKLFALQQGQDLPGYADGGFVGPPSPDSIDPDEDLDQPILASDTPGMVEAKRRRRRKKTSTRVMSGLNVASSAANVIGGLVNINQFDSNYRLMHQGRSSATAHAANQTMQGIQFGLQAAEGGPLGMLSSMMGDFKAAGGYRDYTDPAQKQKESPLAGLANIFGFRKGGYAGTVPQSLWRGTPKQSGSAQNNVGSDLLHEMKSFHKTFSATSFDKILDQNKQDLSARQWVKTERNRSV